MVFVRQVSSIAGPSHRQSALLNVYLKTTLLVICYSTICLAFQAPNSLEGNSDVHRLQQKHDSRFTLMEKPKWLEEAMGDSDSENDGEGGKKLNSSRLSEVLPLSDGLSGFSVDPKLGFCAILTQSLPPSSKDQSRQQRCFHTVVCPSDKERLQSAEALTMVQLAGGLDLGTAIVPPDSLAQIVARQLERDNQEKQKKDGKDADTSSISSEELRQRINLLRIEALPNSLGSTDGGKDQATTANDEGDASFSSKDDASQKQEERNKSIKDSLPRILTAVKSLPGLAGITTDQLENVVQRLADDSGSLDRMAFSKLLDELRQEEGVVTVSPVESQRSSSDPIKLVLLVSIDSNDDSDANGTPSVLQVDAPSIFLGLALSMRYKVPILIDERCFDDERADKITRFDANEILNRFPLFRPLRELYQDAKAMDGFIPSMYQKAKELDNEDKL